MTFDLRSAIRELVEDGVTGPDQVAEKLIAQMSDDEREQILREVLPEYVRATYHNLFKSRAAGDQPRRSANPGRAAAVKTAAPAWLLKPINIGPNQFVSLGSCTAADLDHAISLRIRKADETRAQASKLMDLRALLDAHHVRTVRELSLDVLTEWNDSIAQAIG